jgi:agmatine/peptidylarginine deiminase
VEDQAARDLHRGVRPAYALPWETARAGKADAAFETGNPRWFEETIPPSGAFRGMQEWEPMSGLLVTYDASLISDPTISQTIVDVVRGALQAGHVWVLYDTAAARSTLVGKLASAGVNQATLDAQVGFVQLDLDAFWTIDFGPFPLIRADGSQAFLDFRYYPGREQDDAVPSRLGELWGATVYRMPLDFEGGNFQADGQGRCYTTERELENTGLSQAQLSAQLSEYAHCTQLVVLRDIWNDGTGHVDMLFKLTSTTEAIVGSFTAAQDATAKADMDANETQLKGLGLTVYRMPHPNAYVDPAWGTIPRTYLNSTLYNGSRKINLWPIYTVDKDIEADALAVWQQALPAWTHLGIVADDISTLSGAVHCITRTLPDLPFGVWVPDGTCTAAGSCAGATEGYSGTCASSADCHGPQWLCVQDGSCAESQVDPCDGITYEGCCTGDTVTWCESNGLKTIDCATDAQAPGPHCTWDASAGYYWCGTTVASDPTGNYPRACAPCTPDCTGKVCGSNGCGGTCGACGAGLTCLAGTCVCVPDCAGKACGSNGCGGSCGACGASLTCLAGTCVCVPDCTGKVCGSNGCGGACGTCATGLACVSGACICVPDCAAKACGPDGCGGSCGSCDAGLACLAGVCACVPDCAGKVCGSNGCGGSCGVCGGGEACSQGACVCAPACSGRTCGDDGCGGTCGTCGDHQACVDGACACVPDCAGKSCGDDGCSGTCGTCGDHQACVGSACVCAPDCLARECGDDGCGSSCGSCVDDCTGQVDPLACDAGSGLCVHACCPDCAGRECGDDGCGGSCGTCSSGSCDGAGRCTIPPLDVVEPSPDASDTATGEAETLAEPGPDAAGPDADATTPGSDTTTPGSDTTTPGSDTTTPGSDTTTPGSDTTTPGSDTTTGPDVTVPLPDAPGDDVSTSGRANSGGSSCTLSGPSSPAAPVLLALLLGALLLRQRRAFRPPRG